MKRNEGDSLESEGGNDGEDRSMGNRRIADSELQQFVRNKMIRLMKKGRVFGENDAEKRQRQDLYRMLRTL